MAGSVVWVENLVCTHSVLGNIVLLCVMKQVFIFLLSEQHNYIYLVYLIVIRYYCMFQLPVSAIIKWNTASIAIWTPSPVFLPDVAVLNNNEIYKTYAAVLCGK